MRSRLRAIGILEVLFAGLAAVLIAMLASGLVDYLLRLPGWLRLAMLTIGCVALCAGAWHRLVPALRLRPSLTTLALRVEASELGRAAGLRGRLASGIALADADSAEHGEPASIAALRADAAREADERISRVDPSSLIGTALVRHHGVTAAIGVLAVIVIGAFSPTVLATGATRLLLPLGDTVWPSRYEVVDGSDIEVHPVGAAVPLRALITRTTRDVGNTPVRIVYRVIDGQGSGTERRDAMTPQRVFDPISNGEVYERLLDPGVVVARRDGEPAVLEYSFETPDDRTATMRVLLVEPPEVIAMTARVEPPSYASAVRGIWASDEHPVAVDGGADALIGPVLAGSRVSLLVQLNKPSELSAAEPVIGVESETAPADLSTSANETTIAIAWTASTSSRVRFSLRDAYGLESLEEAVARVDVLQDRPPAATVIEPARDESVLPTAVLALAGEGRDDVGLASVGLDMVRAIVPGGDERSSGAAPEATGEPEPLVRIETTEAQADVETTLDIGRLGLRAGDELWITAVAEDAFDLSGTTHGVQRSDIRRLRVISETELIDEVLSDLAGVRRTAIRLDEQQASINERADRGDENNAAAWSELAREQAGVRDGADRAGETIRRAGDRLERNGMRDDQLNGVLKRAADAAERAASAADQASSGLGSAVRGEDGAPSDESLEATRNVRRALEDLARSLDRGEDAWAVRRAIESLLSDQGELSEQTAQAGRATVGRRADELTETERSVLDEIARKQLDLAERAQEVLDELDEKADEAAESDASQSAALRAAARRGREQGVSNELQRAADAISQNRAADAGRAQQQAQEQLEEMLRDLETAEQQRDQELRRALLSLVESIESLIARQDGAIAQLDQLNDLGAGALHDPMITLHRNTLSVIDEASTNPDTEPVAQPLRRAATAQTQAIVALQAVPIDAAEARRAEAASGGALREALDLAQAELDDAERREMARRKEELADAYRGLLVRQVAVRQTTEPIAAGRLSRRDRQLLRDTSAEQIAIRDALATLPAEYPELADAGVFRFTHERLDDILTAVADRMAAGELGARDIIGQRSAITLLQGLIDALGDPEPSENDDSFSQGSSGQSGGQQGGEPELIPPLAELTLLKTLQQDLFEQTRSAEELGADADLAGSIGEQQNAIADHARTLLEEMKQQQQGGMQPPIMNEPREDEE